MQLMKRSFSNTQIFQPIEAQEDSPLFIVEETPTHYLLAVDIPSLPAGEVRIREKKNEILIEVRQEYREAASVKLASNPQDHCLTEDGQTVVQELMAESANRSS